MRRYRFTCDYRSDVGVWQAGEVVEFAEDFAAWLNRDVSGCVEFVTEDAPEPEPEPEPRAMDEPPQDRMVKRPARKRRA